MTRRPIQLAEARRRRTDGCYRIIPPDRLTVYVGVVADVVGVAQTAVLAPVRTRPVIRARQILDQLLVEDGEDYDPAAISQATGRSVPAVKHSLRTFERRALIGSREMAHLSRGRQLVRVRLSCVVRR